MVYAGWATLLLSAPRLSGQIAVLNMEGTVLLDGKPVVFRPVGPRPGRPPAPDARYHPLITDGQLLETAGGRVEAWRCLFLAENSSLKMLSDHQTDVVVEIRSGSAMVDTTTIRNPAVTVQYQDATIVIAKSGQYRIDADSGRLRIYQGEATVTYGVAFQCSPLGACRLTVGRGPANTVQVHKGEQVVLNEALPVSALDGNGKDAFDRWVAARLTPAPPDPFDWHPLQGTAGCSSGGPCN
jgi:hypothetical protein